MDNDALSLCITVGYPQAFQVGEIIWYNNALHDMAIPGGGNTVLSCSLSDAAY